MQWLTKVNIDKGLDQFILGCIVKYGIKIPSIALSTKNIAVQANANINVMGALNLIDIILFDFIVDGMIYSCNFGPYERSPASPKPGTIYDLAVSSSS